MGVLVLAAAVLQVTVVTGMRILGAEPDLLLVTIVCAALVAGSLPGAIAGFAGGLVVDVMTLGTLGTTSIVLTLAGYWAGRYGETTGRGRAYACDFGWSEVTAVVDHEIFDIAYRGAGTDSRRRRLCLLQIELDAHFRLVVAERRSQAVR